MEQGAEEWNGIKQREKCYGIVLKIYWIISLVQGCITYFDSIYTFAYHSRNKRSIRNERFV